MKRNIITIAFIIFGLVTTSGLVQSAEIMDIPQNTMQKKIKIKKERKSLFKIRTKKDKDENKNAIQTDEQNANDVILSENTEQNEELIAETSQKENKKQEKRHNQNSDEPATEVQVDSNSIEYFPERHEFEAIGDAKVIFPSEKTELHADKIVFNHDTNYIKGFGNVVLIKEGQKIDGEYIQIDLNENNAMMSQPVLNHLSIKIRAKQGIVSETKTEALDGTVTFNDKTSYKFMSRPIFGFNNPMMDEVIPKNFYFKEKYDNKWRLKAKTIVIDSYKDRDIATLKNADIYIKDLKIGSTGNMKLFTDKEQQYIETNRLELGSMRNMGAFVSPGYVFQTPNSSTLRLGPALLYDHEFGIGAMGRFMTDMNKTSFGWGSPKSKFVVKGRQDITENLMLQYGINSYMSNFFLGGRMPKYGMQFVHHKNYKLEDLDVNFQNRFVGGLYHDWGNHDYSTTKFAWQTSSSKPFLKYKNEDRKFAMELGANLQTHAALYGNGDTMGLVRVGPYMRTQYKAWQQYLGFFQGGQAGDSPMYFDKNFYGKSNVVLGESIRVCKYLTLMYATTIVLSNDTPNGDTFQENRFYFMIGPDDLKFIIGYDAYRRNATMGFAMNIGAENSDVEFKRLVLNDPEAIGKKKKSEKAKINSQKKKQEEEKKTKNVNSMERSVTDYEDYEPGFNMLPGGTMLNPLMIQPQGM